MRRCKRSGLIFAVLAACGGGTSGPSLADFLPAVPPTDGKAQSTFAGPIAQANAGELIAGPAATGRVGDYFMRNAKVRFVIEAPTRVIGIVPWGGNVVDATFVGSDAPGDQLGEVGMVYYLGRTCAHDKVEVLLDGAGGGPAVIRSTGKAAINDYINLNALGVVPFPDRLNPDVPDGVECATTYTLQPDADTLQIAWTLYNPGPGVVKGPFGALNDVGGEIVVFSPGPGFSHLSEGGFDAIVGGAATTVPYNTYQGPNIAYGLIPRVQGGVAGLVISGASVLLFGAQKFLDILDPTKDPLNLPAQTGATFELDLVVARQGDDVEAAYLRGQPTTAVSGTVAFAPSGTPARARVPVFRDMNGNGAIDEGTDYVVTTFDPRADGTFSGVLAPGTYLVRADLPDIARSATQTVTVGSAAVTVPALTLAEPARYDYTVVDDATGQRIPARLTVVGQTPVPLAKSAGETYERHPGVVRLIHAAHGTSMAPGTDLSDPPLDLPAGGPYRVWVSHGPEWTAQTVDIATAVAGQHTTLPAIRLSRVVDTSGYVATAFHEHSEGSPDSSTAFEDRVRSLAVEGVELFASTDHDRLTDYAPIIAALGLSDVISSVVGIEGTPFAYGHFNAYPMDYDPTDPSGGAPDWGGPQGLALLPKELWDQFRQRGAQVVQASHPRSITVGSTFQGYFWRAGLAFDFVARTATGVASRQSFPNEVLRLPPGMTLFSDTFDVLEMWNGFGTVDTDGDGVVEFGELDRTLRDWMNFLSLGKVYTPVGNGDTHTRDRDPAGVPRTLVRVPDDSAEAVAAGVADEVWRTLRGDAIRDVVVTNGPFIAVSEPGKPGSAIGRTIAVPSGEPAVLDVTVSAPSWIDFDTVEVFANSTFDDVPLGQASSLTPLLCFTTRTVLATTDPCKAGRGGPQSLVVNVAGGLRSAEVTLSLLAADIETRTGKTGSDAWLVVRARGRRAVYPMILGGAITGQNLAALTTGNEAAVAAALDGIGAPATAFTGAIFLDFDGGGWRAPFAP
jgi:hypothetical protein